MSAWSETESELQVSVERNALDFYRGFIAGRAPLTVDHFDADGANRVAVEMVLLQQALARAGRTDLFARIKFKPERNYDALFAPVNRGDAVAAGTLVWREDARRGQFLLSSALIGPGEYVVGIYTHPDNLAAQKIRTLEDFQRFSVVSNSAWKTDWRTLQLLQPKLMHNSSLWKNTVRMVWSRRVDITLMPFQPSADLALRYEGMTLVPVPGVKLALAGTRHWISSRKHPEGLAFAQALEQGIELLRAEGKITRAYTESGFFDRRVANWKLLNPL